MGCKRLQEADNEEDDLGGPAKKKIKLEPIKMEAVKEETIEPSQLDEHSKIKLEPIKMEAVIKEEPIEPSQLDEHSSGHNTSVSTEQNTEVENRSIKTEETDGKFHALLSFLDY